MTKICRIAVLLLALTFSAPVFGLPKIDIRLLLSAQSARPGDVVWAGLEMDIPPKWHTYWVNGGDAGQPPEIKWTLPPGITAGDIHYPVPEKEIDTAGDTSLTTYVYKHEVVLLVPLTISKSAPSGTVTVTASAKWMECSDICVVSENDASATLTISAEAKPSSDAATIESWRAKVPQLDTNPTAIAYWTGEPAKDGARGLIIDWKTNVTQADFFPFANTNFQLVTTPSTSPAPAGTARLHVIVKTNDGGAWPDKIDGVLVDGGKEVGFEEHLAISPAPAAAPQAAAPAQTAALGAMLGLAFIGGLILNIMPCVLPVIALKILGFVSQSKEEPGRVRRLGLVYGLGVLGSFLVLATLAIAAQRAGGVASWGDAFRNPQFQVVITILITLVALNLFGVFEVTLSGRALGAASEWSAKPGFSGAFFNGVLATLLATPCTAPFLGAALAFAFSQPPSVIVLVFLAAGLGLAFPFVLLCWNPAWLKLMPKPGAWMEKFKIAMGFPMLATVVWLVWVSSSKEDDPLWLGLFLVALALAAWIWGQFVQRGTRGNAVAVIICLLLLGADYVFILDGELQWRSSPQSRKAGIEWKVWSPEAVEAARRDGHPVLVDFTAKSCLTCKLNLASSLEIDRTRAKLKQINAVAFTADDTRNDLVIAQELQRFHASGVPLVLVYSKDLDKEPHVLPTILTPTIVLDALDKAAK